MSPESCSAVIFDLDGTLLDTLEDLAESMNAVLEEMGFSIHPPDKYRCFVGDGVTALARRALPPAGRDEKTVEACAAKMKEEYSRRWARKTRIYPGVERLLDTLAEKNIPMNILSNKTADFVPKVVSRFLSGWPFYHVAGLGSKTPKKPNPQGALNIAEANRVAPEKFVFLGDSDTDMKTACRAGMVPVGAEWGFRTREELLENGAREVIRHPSELLDWIVS